jgi:hypothetical protein
MANIIEFTKRLKKAREIATTGKSNPGNPYGLRGTETIPTAARGFGLITKKKKKPISKPEVI